MGIVIKSTFLDNRNNEYPANFSYAYYIRIIHSLQQNIFQRYLKSIYDSINFNLTRIKFCHELFIASI